MGMFNDLDEAHCFRALCSHPCCWETEHRVSRGIPRHKTEPPVKKCPPIEEGLPSLSIVNVSEWDDGRKPFREKILSTEGSLNNVPHLPLTKQTKDKIKRANLSLPGSNLAFLNTTTNKQTKTAKLNIVHISPLIGCSELPRSPVVMWIPNPNHVPQYLNQNKYKAPNFAIKELICLPSFPLTKSPKVTSEDNSDRHGQRGQVNLWKRCKFSKRRACKGRNCTLEGAGTQVAEKRWVGLDFNPTPKSSTHHYTNNLLSKDANHGSMNQKLPSLTIPYLNQRHKGSLSPDLSLSLGSIKCWRDN